jgi:ABC-type nitrate/sulfonate/bicarbonate transport system substrate-binding protein
MEVVGLALRREPARAGSVARRWRGRVAAWALGLFAGTASAAPLTIAVADPPGFAPVLLAAAQGYFAAEDLDVRLLHCVNGRRCLQHLLDGEAQIATAADTPIALASFSRTAFAVIATIATSPSENKFVARADRGIRTAADLRGRRIGIVRGTSGHYFADRFLLYHGIEQSQVTLVSLDPADQVGPLLRGEVDAVGSYEPMGYRARAQLGANAVLLPAPRLFDVSFNLIAARAGVPDADLVRLLRAIQRAERSIHTEPAVARALIAQRLGGERALVDAIWGDYRFALSLDQSLLATLEGQARWARRESLNGTSGTLPDYLDYVHPGPLQAVEPGAVTLVK